MNRYRLTCMAIAICCISNFIFAQIDFRKFPLDSFRLPDFDYRVLDFTGSFIGSTTNISYKDLESKQSQFNLSPGFRLDYLRFINHVDLQSTRTASVSESASVSQSENPLFADKLNRTFSLTSAFWNLDNLHYKGLTFIETGLFVNTSYRFNFEKEIDNHIEQKTKDLTFSLSISPTIGFGKGRLEPISDVAMAMFILKDAMDLGLDISATTTADIYEFAAVMAQVRNSRVLDNRRMRIQELRSLYSFMQEKNWVMSDDPGFFTVLTDNWYSNIRYQRLSGSRWKYSLTPEFEYRSDIDKLDQTPDEKRINRNIGATAQVEFRKEKPVSLFKDNHRIHRLSINATSENETNNDLEFSATPLIISLENTIGKSWFPNNRTIVSCNLGLDYAYYDYLVLPPFGQPKGQHIVSTELVSNINYFISYKARISASAAIEYAQSTGGNFILPLVNNSFGTNAKANGFHARINATFVVSLF